MTRQCHYYHDINDFRAAMVSRPAQNAAAEARITVRNYKCYEYFLKMADVHRLMIMLVEAE